MRKERMESDDTSIVIIFWYFGQIKYRQRQSTTTLHCSAGKAANQRITTTTFIVWILKMRTHWTITIRLFFITKYNLLFLLKLYKKKKEKMID